MTWQEFILRLMESPIKPLMAAIVLVTVVHVIPFVLFYMGLRDVVVSVNNLTTAIEKLDKAQYPSTAMLRRRI